VTHSALFRPPRADGRQPIAGSRTDAVARVGTAGAVSARPHPAPPARAYNRPMSLLSEPDRQQIREMFADLRRPVRLVLFTQTLGCETCDDARRVLTELAELDARVSVVEHNLVLDLDRVQQFGVDRAPTTAVVAVEEDGTEQDYGVRFVGLTAGYEFSALIDAILLVSAGSSQLLDDSRALLAAVTEPVRIQVFVTPT
jgi:alkyl hydroperoxide reductase subunit AhpF